MEALCCMDRVGSAVKPNCAIGFFVVASLAVFSCQWYCVDSDWICFARATVVCFCFFTWNRCFFRRLILGFQSFVSFVDQSCWLMRFLGECFVGLQLAFCWICFSSRRLSLRCLMVGPSVSCFLLILDTIPTRNG